MSLPCLILVYTSVQQKYVQFMPLLLMLFLVTCDKAPSPSGQNDLSLYGSRGYERSGALSPCR